MSGKRSTDRDWNDAADYVRRINGVAFPRLSATRTGNASRSAPSARDATGRSSTMTRRSPSPLGKPPSKLAPMARGLLFRRLARRRPTLLIRGELSDLITEIADRMQRMAPAMQRVDVPGVGHAPMLTEPPGS